MKSQNQPLELNFAILIFMTATQTNKQRCTAMYVCIIMHAPSDHFQIEARSEELTSCCLNSIDAGYLSLLLRCEGEIRFIRTSPFLLASSNKLHFFSEDARSSHRERRALEVKDNISVPNFRGRGRPHQTTLSAGRH